MLALAYEFAERDIHETVEPVLIRRYEINVDIASVIARERFNLTGKNKKAAGRELNGQTYDEMPALSM